MDFVLSILFVMFGTYVFKELRKTKEHEFFMSSEKKYNEFYIKGK